MPWRCDADCRLSAKEFLVVLIVQVGEVILGAAVSSQGCPIGELLDVVQAAGDAAVTVGVKSVEVDGCPADDAGVPGFVVLLAFTK